MDDLVSEFLVETGESLIALDDDMLTLERDPGDDAVIGNIFRVMHTIKGTCGFIGLQRLASVAHAAENIMDKVRDHKLRATPELVSLMLEAIDRIKMLVAALEETGSEPAGDDSVIIKRLNDAAEGKMPSAPPVSVNTKTSAAVITASQSKTSDLDEEIDFTPIVADYVDGTVAPQEQPKTPDLDSEIDFTPVVADYVDDAAPALESLSIAAIAETISEDHKLKVLDEGMKVATQDHKGKSSSQQSIRVNLDVLEELMQMVGELVLTRNQLLQLTRAEKDAAASLFTTPLQRLNHITTELQEGVMKTRMQPVSSAWSKFPRLIRDLSMELNKKIRLEMIGEDTEIDRQMLEAIKDPLTHMVRNSADHGVERPADRSSKGKSEEGTITLSAYHEGGHVIIKVADDGKGLDVERIKAKAIANGLATEEALATMSDKQIYQFVFRAGFSTAEKVTSVSGRGVGMDVVVTNIEKIGGTVELNSEPGKGSEFIIKLPLTLAIMPVLIVEVASNTFAIPQIRVSEILRINSKANDNGKDIQTVAVAHTMSGSNGLVSQPSSAENALKVELVNDSPVLRLRGRLIPLLSIAQTLKIRNDSGAFHPESGNPIESYVVVCEVGSQTVGLMVDKVQHTEEIVLKPASPLASHLEVYSGCTILGNGRVIMILDPNGLIKQSGATDLNDSKSTKQLDDDSSQDEITSFLMFTAWGKTRYIVPLELVARLEEVDMSKTEWSGSIAVVQYRGGLMRLATVHPDRPLPTEGTYDVIVFMDGQRVMGLVVEKVLDIVRQPMDLQSVSSDAGWIGAMVVDGKTTDMVDISYWFGQTFQSWLGHGDAHDITGSVSEQRQRNVLLVDDSAFFRKFMQPVITAAGFNVTIAENGRRGLDILMARTNFFDLVITDIDMPVMNGLEFVRAAREHFSREKLPFVALTSHTEDDLGGQASVHGFNSFVMKSERDKLVATITAILHEQTQRVA